MRGDTIRWLGVKVSDADGAGMTIAGIRLFLAEVDALAEAEGMSVEEAIPVVERHKRGGIRWLWVGVRRRERWGRLRLITVRGEHAEAQQ